MAELTVQNVQNMLNQQTMQNNAWSAEQAQKQMDFQEHMSNTAYQRQVADLKAAGLNPALVYGNGGSGAATSAGAMAAADTSSNAALTNFLSNLIQTQNQLELQRNNAELQRELTDKTNSLTAMIAELNRQVSLQTNLETAQATRAAAAMSAGAVQYSAEQSRAGTEYSARQATARETLSQAGQTARLTAQLGHDTFMAQNYPTTQTQAIAAAANAAAKGINGGTASSAITNTTNSILKALGVTKKAVQYGKNTNYAKNRYADSFR